MSRKTKPRLPSKPGNSKPGKSNLNNSLRIIGGKWRGRKLQFPDSQGLRPTTDRVRETLFNWLAPAIQNTRCLDLFAGSGALAFEALSRGASQVTLIDTTHQVIDQLKRNLVILECSNANLLSIDALDWLKTAALSHAPFDIVFVDPPFNQNLAEPCCELLEQQGLVKDGSYIYIETELSTPLTIPANWAIHRQKKAGQVAYYLCMKTA